MGKFAMMEYIWGGIKDVYHANIGVLKIAWFALLVTAWNVKEDLYIIPQPIPAIQFVVIPLLRCMKNAMIIIIFNMIHMMDAISVSTSVKTVVLRVFLEYVIYASRVICLIHIRNAKPFVEMEF